MTENHHKDVARHRIEKAEANLSAGRQSYYCILTAMRALLALKHHDSHRQEGVITLFHKHLIQTQQFPKDFNRVIIKIKSLREDADYGDFVEIAKEQAFEKMGKAENFLKKAEQVFVKLLSNNSLRKS